MRADYEQIDVRPIGELREMAVHAPPAGAHDEGRITRALHSAGPRPQLRLEPLFQLGAQPFELESDP